MLNTYNAVLKGNQLEFTDDLPQKSDRPLKVHVTILEESSSEELPSFDIKYRGQKMAKILEMLSKINAFTGIDPIAWQREMRFDRQLPNRTE